MKTIKIKFVDFWPGFNPADSFFHTILSRRFNIEYSESPDYLFYSVFGYNFIKFDCVRIFYTGEQVSPDFDLADYAIGFDYMSFGDRYIRYPLYKFEYSKKEILNINYPETNDYYLNRGFATFVSSNPNALSQRDLFFRELMKYKFVSSGGKHLNNVNGPIRDKKIFLSSHKFNIAFENTRYPGITSEKIVDAFAARTIPIYFGNPLISLEFNRDSYIDVSDYASIELAINRIIEIDNDDEAYLNMLKAKKLTSQSDKSQDIGEFLYSIFDQELAHVRRRPFSQRSELKDITYNFLFVVNRLYSKLPKLLKREIKVIFMNKR